MGADPNCHLCGWLRSFDAIGYVWRCVQCLPTDRDHSCVSWEQSPRQWLRSTQAKDAWRTLGGLSSQPLRGGGPGVLQQSLLHGQSAASLSYTRRSLQNKYNKKPNNIHGNTPLMPASWMLRVGISSSGPAWVIERDPSSNTTPTHKSERRLIRI